MHGGPIETVLSARQWAVGGDETAEVSVTGMSAAVVGVSFGGELPRITSRGGTPQPTEVTRDRVT
jgi:hypothetical protein